MDEAPIIEQRSIASCPAIDMEQWLAQVRSLFAGIAADLLPLFDTYSGEALFGRSYIAADIASLPRGARVLEVGAGGLLLSCQLLREGFEVTALEPTGSGFSHFDRMRQIVMDHARSQGCVPALLDFPAERLDVVSRYDYAFSINVMEHVDDVAQVIANVMTSLRAGGRYRFTCPNYLFPYEPHFNIPTFFSKNLTEKAMRKRIFNSQRVTDPAGTWASLNWITVPQIKRSVRRIPGASLALDPAMLVSTLERVVSDQRFAERRSGAVRAILGAMVRLQLHRLLGLVPALFQPIIDCTITKTDAPGEA
ncbi:class I SAM-dependent methyltransferase [Lacisediminimonas profundi]|uniref:class I SAM-dependent methyltransferase n=1 Tax=Lacisediminimonas profundi TaxID=2603856 RepID=UPI00124B3FAF|nr:methyltransferase [Lacisediminimonas profundi]